MIENLLSNAFAKTRVGNRRFAKYADEYRGRVRAALPTFPADSLVPARLATVDAAYATFLGAEKTNAVASAVRQGKTVTNDAAIRRFQRFITQQAKLIGGQLDDPDNNITGTKTAIYQEFFPKGVTALTEANKANIETEADTFLKAAQAHPTLGSAGLAAKVEALLADIVGSRTQQLGEDGKGGDQVADTGRDAARRALAVAEFRLLLALLDHHAEAPEEAGRYVNEAILKEGRRRAAQAAADQNPTV